MKIKYVIIILIVGVATTIAYFVISKWDLPIGEMEIPNQNMSSYDITHYTQSISFLNLNLSTNATYLKNGQTIGLDIQLNNTSNKTLIVNPQKNWSMYGLELEPCENDMPFGIAILQGNYLQNNMTVAKHLLLYPNGPYFCQAMYLVTSYIFQPLTDNALIKLEGQITHFSEMKKHLSFRGYFVDNMTQPFPYGRYTIIGGDEWGDVVIRHFVVGNSTNS